MEYGYVYVQDIQDNGTILVGDSVGVGISITYEHVKDIIPDDNILEVLRSKKRERDKIQKDIERVEEYINLRYSLKSEVI